MEHGPHARVRLVVELLVSAAGAWLVVWAFRADREWFDLHVGEEFCVYKHAQLDVQGWWRVFGAVAGVVLLLLVRPIAGRWASRRTAAVALREVASVAVAAILALVVSDLWLRRPKSGPPGEPSLVPPQLPDARYGWANPKHTSVVIPTAGRDVEYAFDSRGNRAPSVDYAPDLTKPTLLVAGESFASGIGVPWEESFPALLEKRLGIQVIDTAVSAWDNGQAYLRMHDELAALEHPTAVVTLVLPQQLNRDARDGEAWHPKFSLGSDGALVPRWHAPDWWIASPLRQRAHDVVILHDEEPLRVARTLFEATTREVLARGAYPLFLLTNWGPPCLLDETGAPAVDRRLFGGLDVPHVRVDLDPSCEDIVTHHPNAHGHDLLARAIERVLVGEHMVTPPVTTAAP